MDDLITPSIDVYKRVYIKSSLLETTPTINDTIYNHLAQQTKNKGSLSTSGSFFQTNSRDPLFYTQKQSFACSKIAKEKKPATHSSVTNQGKTNDTTGSKNDLQLQERNYWLKILKDVENEGKTPFSARGDKNSYRNFEEDDDELDVRYRNIVNSIRQICYLDRKIKTKSELNGCTISQGDRIFVAKWIKKLNETVYHRLWKKNRNLYARLLLAYLTYSKNVKLGEPFNILPDDKQLPTMSYNLRCKLKDLLFSKKYQNSPIYYDENDGGPPQIISRNHLNGCSCDNCCSTNIATDKYAFGNNNYDNNRLEGINGSNSHNLQMAVLKKNQFVSLSEVYSTIGETTTDSAFHSPKAFETENYHLCCSKKDYSIPDTIMHSDLNGIFERRFSKPKSVISCPNLNNVEDTIHTTKKYGGSSILAALNATETTKKEENVNYSVVTNTVAESDASIENEKQPKQNLDEFYLSVNNSKSLPETSFHMKSCEELYTSSLPSVDRELSLTTVPIITPRGSAAKYMEHDNCSPSKPCCDTCCPKSPRLKFTPTYSKVIEKISETNQVNCYALQKAAINRMLIECDPDRQSLTTETSNDSNSKDTTPIIIEKKNYRQTGLISSLNDRILDEGILTQKTEREKVRYMPSKINKVANNEKKCFALSPAIVATIIEPDLF